MQFDIIVGNPPYNVPREECNGNTLWPDFVKKSLSLLKDGGFLCLIHPSGWRKPDNELWSLITKNQIHYLKILGEQESKKTFGVGVRVDWYVLQKIQYKSPTIIMDEKHQIQTIDLSTKPFLPNYLISEIYDLLGEPKCQILHDGFYSTNNNRISRTKTRKHKHPIFLSLNKHGDLKLCYSSENLGHIGISKIILNGGRYIYPMVDFKGLYGINVHSFGIPINSEKEGEEMIKAFNSNKFGEIAKAAKWSNFQTDWKFFTYLKKDFWKEFLPQEENLYELPAIKPKLEFVYA